jgi:hypothetical protein
MKVKELWYIQQAQLCNKTEIWVLFIESEC